MSASSQTGSRGADAGQVGLQTALQLIVERARSSTAASGAAVSLGDCDGMVCRASSGAAPDVGARLRPDAGLTGCCLRSADMVLCNDAHSDPRVDASAAQRLNLRSMLVMPVFAFGRLAGVLQVLSPRPHAFDNTCVLRLAHFAQVLTATLERRQAPARLESGPEAAASGEQSCAASPAIQNAAAQSPAIPSPKLDTARSMTSAPPAPPAEPKRPTVEAAAPHENSGAVAHPPPTAEVTAPAPRRTASPARASARSRPHARLGPRTLLYVGAVVVVAGLLGAARYLTRHRAPSTITAPTANLTKPEAPGSPAILEPGAPSPASSAAGVEAGGPNSAAAAEAHGTTAATAKAPIPGAMGNVGAGRPTNVGPNPSLRTLAEKVGKMKIDELASLEKRAAAGDPEARVLLGLMYTEGNLLKKDLARAIGWYRQAAEQAYAPAEEALGIAYLLGSGVPKNGAQAARWYARAAQHGSVIGANELGTMYSSGDSVPRNFAEAARWYRVAAERGDAAAEYNLARMYHLGQGVPASPVLEFQWLRKSADQGFPAAQYNLALMYQQGVGTAANPAEAVRLLHAAAGQGYLLAQTSLGYVYLKGLGVSVDHAQSLKWYRMAAEQGEPLAAYALSVRYFSGGDGVAQDYSEAAKWTGVAAEKGHPDAQYNLGLMYERGIGVTADAVEAAKWYRRAAEQAVGSAQFRLGLAYASGKGVSKDVIAAYKWLALSQEPGSSDEMRALQKEMTPAQISGAQHSAEQWRSARRPQ